MGGSEMEQALIGIAAIHVPVSDCNGHGRYEKTRFSQAAPG
jgi:hypothetical protein